MDYIIKESRLIKLIDNYITESVGELYKTDSTNVNAREGDFQIIDENGSLVFEYFDYHLVIKQELFVTIMNYLNLNTSQTEGLFRRWFEYRFPDNLIIAAYCSIYY